MVCQCVKRWRKLYELFSSIEGRICTFFDNEKDHNILIIMAHVFTPIGTKYTSWQPNNEESGTE